MKEEMSYGMVVSCNKKGLFSSFLSSLALFAVTVSCFEESSKHVPINFSLFLIL